MTASTCEWCGLELVGPVAAVLHYDTAGGASPCDRRRAAAATRDVVDLAIARRARRPDWNGYQDPAPRARLERGAP